MKPNLQEQFIQLEQLSIELSSAQNLPSLIPYQTISVPIVEVIESFNALVKEVATIEKQDIDPILLGVHLPGIVSTTAQLVTYGRAFIASPVSPNTDNFFSYVWSLRSSLFWLSPQSLNSDFTKWLLSASGKKSNDEINRLAKSLENSFNESVNAQKKIEKFVSESTKLFNQIHSNAQEVSNAKTNAAANAVESQTSKASVESVLSELLAANGKTKTLLLKIESIQKKADKALASSSQVGLANSFRDRKDLLEGAQVWWGISFFSGLLLLLSLSIVSVINVPVFHLPSIFTVTGDFDHWAFISRILIAGPLIWFTWFSARQFGRNVALIEDYAFKEASALAFVGYKKDMEDDLDMVKLLRESAIHNFANQPSRLITKSEAASPLHDLIERALEDKNFDKVLKFVETFKKS